MRNLSYITEIKRIYNEQGFKGFARGYQGMLIRDGPGFGIYFMTFAKLKAKLGVSESDKQRHYNGLSSQQVGLRQFVSGGLAGGATWMFCYPADLIKTKL